MFWFHPDRKQRVWHVFVVMATEPNGILEDRLTLKEARKLRRLAQSNRAIISAFIRHS